MMELRLGVVRESSEGYISPRHTSNDTRQRLILVNYYDTTVGSVAMIALLVCILSYQRVHILNGS